MKKITYIIIIFFLICIGFFIFININTKKDVDVINKVLTNEEKVDKLLKDMTLEEKIGQMLMIYYKGINYDKTLSNSIKMSNPGGFIIFKDNVQSYTQLSNFISSMQKDSKIPMFISTDQEGGIVQRIKDVSDADVTIIPSMNKVGIKNDKILSYNVGKVIGEELNAFSINMDFAPVIDINSNPLNRVIGNRSFGNTAEIVSDMGISLAKGISDSRVIPVYKHFPGHGDTVNDSHVSLPISNKTKKQLYELELKPFIDAIKNDAPVIMIGHIALPKITGDNTPASLSKKIVTDLLVNELGYKGVIITDALNMGALTNNYSYHDIVINAINAGDNMLLMPGSSSSTIKLIEEALKNKEITQDKIDISVKKILLLKYKFGLFDNVKVNDKSVIGSKEHKDIIEKL